MNLSLETLNLQVKTSLKELLHTANLEKDDIFVLGCSTSEVQGEHIGKDSNITIGRTIVKTLLDVLEPLGINLAVQGCEHINRALVVERHVAKDNHLDIVTVFPTLHAGGAAQIAAFENFKDPVEVEHITAEAGMDIGDTSIGMHVKFVQIPVRTSINQIGEAHTTFLRSRPKLIGGQRAKYTWDPLGDL